MPISGRAIVGPRSAYLSEAELISRYVRAFVVAGDGVDDTGGTDSTAAIQSIVDAAIAVGGQVVFPPGVYSHTGLDFGNANGLHVVGLGGLYETGTPTDGAVLSYTSSGSGTAVDVNGATGEIFESLGITHTSARFTGRLVDARTSSYVQMLSCQIGGDSGVESSVALDLDGAIEARFASCKFIFYDVGVSGALSTGSGFSTAHLFTGCTFLRGNATHVRNGGENWAFYGCHFGELTGGFAGSFSNHTGTSRPKGMAFTGCWFGDASAGTNAQLEVNGDAFSVTGCVFGIWNGSALKMVVNSIQGLVFQGNRVQGAGSGYVIHMNSTRSHGSMVWGPVSYAGVADVILGTPPLGTVFYDANGHNIKATTVHPGPSSENALTWKNGSGQEVLRFNQSNDNVYLFDPAVGALRWRLAPSLLLASGVTSRVGTETGHQFEVHTNGTRRAYWTAGGSFVQAGDFYTQSALRHEGATVGFYSTPPVAKQTGVAVSTAAIHAALVNLGLIGA